MEGSLSLKDRAEVLEHAMAGRARCILKVLFSRLRCFHWEEWSNRQEVEDNLFLWLLQV